MVDFTPPPINQFMTALYLNDFATAQAILQSNQITSISYQTFMLIVQKGAASIIEMTLRDPRVQAYVALGSYEAVRWTTAYGHVPVMEILLRLPNALEYAIGNNELINIARQNGHLEMAYRLSLLSHRPVITPQYEANIRQPLKRALDHTEEPMMAAPESLKHYRADKPNH